MVMDGWTESSSMMGNPGMLLGYLARVNRNNHVDTAEDDDGLMKGVLHPWMILEHSIQCMQQLFCNHGGRIIMAAATKNTKNTMTQLSLLPRFDSPVS
ncbi:predicted protein [Lichtheimia corymbifera JMRC:FSU:9682]|uniref:Uncharacterized protein n=1 Tax=Lichtheimia corymbifera JMRC:FSU:9682 TaxID=1263082 RepID=A0A068RZQ2_9FUNG|nr:predicted protein [Lichtheimia corymbifera JMRC:FSU:9682]